MGKFFKKVIISVMIATMLFNFTGMMVNGPVETITVEAHSGRTDSRGGHKDNKNKSGLGPYHYHCGGYPAHLHKNGVCPYKASVVKSTKSTSKTSKTLIKNVQKKLNKLGYKCGKADGIMGKNTKKALKRYQKDHGLKVDGVIGKEVKKTMGLK